MLAALLGLEPGMLAVPAGSCLVVDHARVPTRAAYVPGYRQPHSYGADPPAAGPALARPPRRVELSLPDPLLRHFAVLDTPDTGSLGVAGGRVLLDAVGRAGALLFVISADQAFTAAELHLLAEVDRAAVAGLLRGHPRGDRLGRAAGRHDGDGGRGGVRPVGRPYRLRRAGVRSTRSRSPSRRTGPPCWPPCRASPGPAGIPPGRPTTPALRRALVGWAADEGLRRASAQPPVLPGEHGRVARCRASTRVSSVTAWTARSGPAPSGSASTWRWSWPTSTSGACRRSSSGSAPPACRSCWTGSWRRLSLLATAQCDQAVRAVLDEAAARVFGAPLAEGVRQRIAKAVRWGLADHPAGQELDRVLLVTSTAGVAGLSGAGAVDALAGLPAAARVEVLPPVGVALSGGCWQHWRGPGNDDPNGARSWAQRALREVELELSSEVSRRFEVIRSLVGAVLADAVDHGILLA